MEQVLSSFSEVVQLAVRKVYSLSGQSISELNHFFTTDDVFFVYGNERPTPIDFELEFEESKQIQQYKKIPGLRNGWVLHNYNYVLVFPILVKHADKKLYILPKKITVIHAARCSNMPNFGISNY